MTSSMYAPGGVATPSGALGGLEPLALEHLAPFKSAVEAGRQVGWAYCFGYLLAKVKPGRRSILLSEEAGSLCIYQERAGARRSRLDLVFPPIPLSPRALRLALERANDFNGDRSARVLRIDSGDREAVGSIPSLRLRQRRMQYIFAPERYQSLAGGELHTVRRNVSLVERRAGVEVARFDASHAEGCSALLSEWRERHRREHGDAGGGGFSRRLLAIAGTLPESDLTGQVVLIDGRVAAFALGGMIRPGLACSLERKNDATVRGLSYFQFRSFLQALGDYERVNDGSDAKRGGLRQFKDSFRPVAMEPEYSARQQRRA